MTPSDVINNIINTVVSAISVFVASPAFDWFLSFSLIFLIIFVLVRIYLSIRARCLSNIVYERHFSEEYLYEGDKAEIIETVRNCGFFPLFRVDIEAYYTAELKLDEKTIQGHADDMQCHISRFNLWPFMQIKRHHPITCTSRGYYEINSVTIYRKNADIPIQAHSKIYVFPKPLPLNDVNYATGIMPGESLSFRPIHADPFSISGIRDYRFGDTVSQINFKASARFPTNASSSSPLKVNNLDFCSNRKLMVFMDFHLPFGISLDGAEYNRRTERGLSFAAEIIRDAIYSGFRVGFVANCRCIDGSLSIKFPCESGEVHLIEILKSMALIRPSDGASFVGLLDEAISLPLENTEIILINHVLTDDVSPRIEALIRYGNSIRVITLGEDS